MKRLVMEPVGWPCTLRECPPGFFLYEDTVCYKTEYERMEPDGPVNIPGDKIRWKMGTGTDAYNSAGEHFCVGTPEEREKIMVQPLEEQWEEY